MDSIRSVFSPAFLGRLDGLQIQMVRQVNLGYGGQRKSLVKGNAMEFSDFKEYTPGDDVRRIDWNSFSRLDKVFVKLFEEEKQATMNLFIDCSKSMDFGQVNKLWYAKVLAAAISYLSLHNADRLNFWTCGDSLTLAKANVGSKGMFPSVVRFLDTMAVADGANLAQALDEAVRFRLGAGVSFILSDLFAEDTLRDSIQQLQSKKQEVVLIHILAKEETAPDVTDAVRLIDRETNQNLDIMMTRDVLELYHKTLDEFCANWKAFCVKRKIKYIEAGTDGEVLNILSKV